MENLEEKTKNTPINIGTEEPKHSIFYRLAPALPLTVALGGFGGLAYLANKGEGTTGWIVLGLAVICSAGLTKILGLNSYDNNDREF